MLQKKLVEQSTRVILRLGPARANGKRFTLANSGVRIAQKDSGLPLSLVGLEEGPRVLPPLTQLRLGVFRVRGMQNATKKGGVCKCTRTKSRDGEA